MTKVSEIVRYCDNFLNAAAFRDYAPNGLQVQGVETVETIVSGVTATQALIEHAADLNADMLLVHHGYFWKGEDPCLVGMKGQRVRALIQHNMNLVAYHLPLDAHPQAGNNAQLAEILNIQNVRIAGAGHAKDILFYGELAEPMNADKLAAHIEQCLSRKPLHISGSENSINQIAWCTGGAQGFLDQAATLGVDAYLSGEISEKTTHEARECGIHYFAAGHHATERYGVKALGEHLAQHFGLQHHFVDIDNPA